MFIKITSHTVQIYHLAKFCRTDNCKIACLWNISTARNLQLTDIFGHGGE